MELPLRLVANATAEIGSLADPAVANFRFFVTGTGTAGEPQWDLPGSCAVGLLRLRFIGVDCCATVKFKLPLLARGGVCYQLLSAIEFTYSCCVYDIDYNC